MYHPEVLCTFREMWVDGIAATKRTKCILFHFKSYILNIKKKKSSVKALPEEI